MMAQVLFFNIFLDKDLHLNAVECKSKFYETLFKKRKQKSAAEIKSFLRHLNIPKLSEDKS